MPRPMVPDAKRTPANRIFVDRDDARLLFTTLVGQISANSAELLVFYGISGQGKSALCREFSRIMSGRFRTQFRDIRLGLVDFKDHQLSEPALVMLWVRDAVAASDPDLRFPAFDLAFAKYWNDTYTGQAMPEFRGGWLAEEPVKVALEAVPYVGSLLARLARNGMHAARRHFTKRNNDALAPIFRNGEILPAIQIRERLPELLASDLSDYQERNPATRFVVLIDEYERLFEHGGLAAAARDNAYDQMVRDFVSCASGVLVAIFGREHLEWSKFRPDWKEWLEQAHHLLGGLSQKDADIFLQAVPISEPAIRGDIIQSASNPEGIGGEKAVLPVMLDLAVDHYLSLKEGDKEPTPESFTINSPDFASRRDELLRRFLRQYDPGLESTLKRLAVVQRFDRDAATFLV